MTLLSCTFHVLQRSLLSRLVHCKCLFPYQYLSNGQRLPGTLTIQSCMLYFCFVHPASLDCTSMIRGGLSTNMYDIHSAMCYMQRLDDGHDCTSADDDARTLCHARTTFVFYYKGGLRFTRLGCMHALTRVSCCHNASTRIQHLPDMANGKCVGTTQDRDLSPRHLSCCSSRSAFAFGGHR